MLRSIIVLIFLFSASAQATVFLGLGAGGRMIKSDDNNFETKFVPQIYGGYKILPWAFALEGLHYSQKSGAGTSYTMDNSHYEISAYALRFLDYEDGRSINPYLVAGFGLFQERIKSNFMGTVNKDKSEINSALKIGAGGWAQLGTMAFLNLELKGMYSEDYSPDLIFELSSRVGVEF